VPIVPGLLEIAAVIDGDPVEPGAPGGFAPELMGLAEGFQEDVVRGVLGFLGVSEKTEGKVINRPAVLGVKAGKPRGRQTDWRLVQTWLRWCGLAHERFHAD
jgi:hypothetical protein